MATGTAVATGDLITAAKMNLKQETGASLATLGILDQSGAGAEDLRIVVSENLTANRNLTIIVNDAARTINLTGDVTTAGAFVTSGAFSLTLTTTATTNVTLPTTGTLATLAGTESLSGKTISMAGSLTFVTALDIIGAANTAATIEITDATTKLLAFDSRNTVSAVISALFTASAPTIVAAAGVVYTQVGIAALSVTLTGGTGVTAMYGLALDVAAQTLTDGTAVTVSDASAVNFRAPIATGAGGVTVTRFSTVRIAGAPTTAGSGVITNAYALHVDAGSTRLDGNLLMNDSGLDLVILANTTAAWEISDGTTKYYTLDSRTATDNVVAHTFNVSAPTIANGAGTTFRLATNGAFTLTLSTATLVTALNGLSLYLDTPTVNQSGGAVTVTTASTLYVISPVPGASVTFTNRYVINTNVSAFLTNAGVWTDASTREVKHDIQPINFEEVLADIQRVQAVRYIHNDPLDMGFRRYGLIAEDVPDFLATPGRKGIGALHVASFAVAGIKYLKSEHDALEEEVKALRLEVAALRQSKG